MEFLIKKYKDVSHQSIEKIKQMQRKHSRDIIQPYDQEGKVNPEYLKYYSAKNMRVSDDDIRYLAKTGQKNLIQKIQNDKRN